MKEEYEDFLLARHPKILSRVAAYGIGVGDGWFNIIDLLCKSLQEETDHRGAPQVVALQIKQKFGGLRFYVDHHSPEQGALLQHAELLAERTCEICGAPGERVSLDGWIVATCTRHRTAFREPPPGPRPIRVFVDMDDVLTDFRPAFEAARAAEPASLWPQATPGFFSALEPIPDAVTGMRVLDAMGGVDVQILTAPSPRNPHSYSEKRLWIEQHLGYPFVKRLHISPRKDFFKGDLLVDDNEKGKGQENFEGSLLKFGSDFCRNWPEAVVRVLMYRGDDPCPAPIRARLTNHAVGDSLGIPPRLGAGLTFYALDLMSWLLNVPLPGVLRLISANPEDSITWKKEGLIPHPWSRRIYYMARLFDRTLIMMRADLDKTRAWLSTPLPVLGGRTPLAYLSEEDAITELDKVINKIGEGFP